MDDKAGSGWEQEQLEKEVQPTSTGTHIAQRTVKAFIYINDVAEDQGCTSCVRGSHRLSPLGVGPNGLFDFVAAGFPGSEDVEKREDGYRAQSGFAGSAHGRTAAAGYAPTSLMPNHVKFAAKAGSCMVFDLATCASDDNRCFCHLCRSYVDNWLHLLRAHCPAKHEQARAVEHHPGIFFESEGEGWGRTYWCCDWGQHARAARETKQAQRQQTAAPWHGHEVVSKRSW
eukprot:SAG31_NODE_848_length_11534_cov_8.897463_12_plen_229_part_00